MARERFSFWLDLNKDDELMLAEQIDDLKRRRLFTRTIRDGIRLICDLRRGNLDVLLELFPELKHRLQPLKPVISSEESLRLQLERLEQLLLSGTGDTRLIPTVGQPAGGLKSIDGAGAALPPPIDDNDDDLPALVRPVATAGAGKTANRNFLNSMMNLG